MWNKVKSMAPFGLGKILAHGHENAVRFNDQNVPEIARQTCWQAVWLLTLVR